MNEAPGNPNPALLTKIARELATETYTLEQIFQRYDIDQTYYDSQIAANEFFKKVHAEYTKEWQAIGSTHKRLAFAAAAALEEQLPILADRMGDRNSGLSDAVATAKLFRELAGIAPPSSQPGIQQGGGFSIHIDFGGHTVALEAKEAPALEQPTIEAAIEQTLPPLDQGETSTAPLATRASGASSEPPQLENLFPNRER